MGLLLFTNSMILISILFAGMGAYWLYVKQNGASALCVGMGAFYLALIYV